jgi:hypothetical protein
MMNERKSKDPKRIRPTIQMQMHDRASESVMADKPSKLHEKVITGDY